MKKTFKFIGLLAMAAVLFSCEKKIDPVNPTPKDDTEQGTDIAQYDPSEYLVSFGATIETPGTKATIDPGTGKVAFEENDEVLVVSGDKTATYYFNGTEFVPIQTESPIAISENGMTVYYPYSESDPEFSVSEGTVSFIMPLSVVDTEDLGMKAPMAAQIVQDGASFKAEFKNICSVLQVNVTGELEISSVKLQNAGSSRMPLGEGATFTIGWNDEAEPTMTANESAENAEISILREVTLSATPQTFYYIIPAGVAYTDVSILTQFANEASIGGVSTFTVSRGNWTADRNQIYTMSFYAGLFSGGDGTEENPYKIANSRDFKNLIKYCSEGYGYDPNQMITATTFLAAHYQQTADIDLKSAAIEPIGSTSAPFTGVYDGNSKKLENVQISTTSNDTGLFAYLDGATVKDLTVSGTIQSTGGNVGSLAGHSDGALISRYVNEAEVKGGQFVGGIVGNMNDGKIYACVNSADVTSTNTEAGGIVGRIQGGTIRACYTSAGILVSGYSRIGGIAGYQSNQGGGASLIINCAAKSNIKSTNSGNKGAAGGLVGYMYSAADKGDVVLINSVALGSGIYNTKQADSYLGAIVGQVNGAEALCYVRNCYSQHNSTTNTGASVYYSADGSNITNTKQTYMGGIYGYLQKGTVQNCYCVGADNANGNGINSNASVGAGSKGTDGAAGNTRMIKNAVKNGTATVNPSGWTIAFSLIKPTTVTSAYLMDIMNLGTWTDSNMNARQSYTSSEGTPETVCEWVGLNGTSPSSYDPAYPVELKELGSQYYPQ